MTAAIAATATRAELASVRAELVAELAELERAKRTAKEAREWREVHRLAAATSDVQGRIAAVNAELAAVRALPGTDQARLSRVDLSEHEQLMATVGWATRQGARLLALLWDEHNALARWLAADDAPAADQDLLQDALEACHERVLEAFSETAGRLVMRENGS